MNDFSEIKVFPGIHQSGVPFQVRFVNPTENAFLGAGAQGAVFQISPDRCVKIYPDEADARLESETLYKASSAAFIPGVYEIGSNYIVMDYIKGPNLLDYLSGTSSLPDLIAEQLVYVINEMKRVGFSRMDAACRHIFVTPFHTLKIIDHVNSYRTIVPYPVQLLQGLETAGYLDSFLVYVKNHHSNLYTEWEQAGL